MRAWLHAHGTTAAAVLLGVALTVPYALMAVGDFLAARDPSRIDLSFRQGLGGLGIGAARGDFVTADQASVALWIMAFIETIVVVLVSATLIRVALRREHARGSGMAVFGLLGVVTLGVATANLLGDQPTEGAGMAALSGLVCLTVVALLWVPSTEQDFMEKERERLVAELDRHKVAS